ncbi:cytochrome P450 6B2-like [Leguminivora glycinivorella]|uniref:cytochrome P450 6B2-like n=1 Tax=Leguminivora glycinivorella TaxID=1035111 RepID=UPI00200EBC17|nr:cytochrome P450 6B2-like [Leguminivora glycinivorella]
MLWIIFGLLTVVVVVVVLIYLYGTRTFSYWAKRGVRHDAPIPFFGTAKRQFLHQISVADMYHEMYQKYSSEKFVGYYLMTTPVLVLRDPELIKCLLVSDFNYFSARNMLPMDEHPEPLLKNLFSCEGDLWKLLRQRMTSAFTTGKLKAMFPLIVARAEKLQRVAGEAAASGAEVDVRDLMARYTTDFIGACGFGIDTDTLSDNNNMFRKLGKRIFVQTKRDAIVTILKYAIPSLMTRFHFFSPEVENVTVKLVKTIMAERNYKNSGKNDYIDMLLDLKGKGKMIGESLMHTKADGTPCMAEIEMDDEVLVAQVFLFFAAGSETSSAVSSYTLHELAHHPEHRRRCQEEIDAVLARHDNKLSYDSVREMKFLDMCFSEGMRLFPSVGFLQRMCVKPYIIPGTDMTIDPGVNIIVSVKGLHLDPQYFPDPEEFRPERFHPDNVSAINKYTYLPFGTGPRACIGERLGYMQSLAGLAALLSQFSVAPSISTLRKPIIDPKVLGVQSVKGGLPLTLTARKKIKA